MPEVLDYPVCVPSDQVRIVAVQAKLPWGFGFRFSAGSEGVWFWVEIRNLTGKAGGNGTATKELKAALRSDPKDGQQLGYTKYSGPVLYGEFDKFVVGVSTGYNPGMWHEKKEPLSAHVCVRERVDSP